MLKKTTEQFIIDAKLIHGNKYDYSLVEYDGSFNKIIIICPEHGEFSQTPNNHLQWYGCDKCGNNRIAKFRNKTNDYFIEKAKVIHHNKYDYSLVNYINAKSIVKIICSEHGEFEQIPYNHLSGLGCKLCGNVLNTTKKSNKRFISAAKKLNGVNYDYSLFDNNLIKIPIKIKCKKQLPIVFGA